MATTSRLLQIIGLFCKRALQKRLYSAKETYNFKEPANDKPPHIWGGLVAGGCVSHDSGLSDSKRIINIQKGGND